MHVDDPVPLVRRFSPVLESDDDSDEREIQALIGYRDVKTWQEIDNGYRSVILAEAGAGKTHEMKARAEYVEQQGHSAFFIRIEDIDDRFEQSFEVGSAESFSQWLDSDGEAWFYLDSVDEARLDNPTTFEKAIRRFSARIRHAQLRAHICISSRPYAWRTRSDRELVRRHLPFQKPRTEPAGEDPMPIGRPEQPEDALEILMLQQLEEAAIRQFAAHRSVPEIDDLIQALERTNLMVLAGRPFDLQAILDKWTQDSALGGRTDLLRHNIDSRLREIDPDRETRQPLNLDKARSGARALAAAVVLTGEAGIRVPDTGQARPGIDAQEVLADWVPGEVHNLLGRALFDDVIYGAVRFRHREVREFLAAEWLGELLRNGNSRHAIESLIVREQYGSEIVSPRLRVVLPWLILEDQEIRRRVLAIHPEIVVEGGDPARLPLPERKNILADIVGRIDRREDDRSARDNEAIARIAQPDLASHTLALISRHADNDDAIFFLGRLVWQGEMLECVPPLLTMAADPERSDFARIAATRAVMTCGTAAQQTTLWNLLLNAEQIPRRLSAELVENTGADPTSVPLLLASMDRLSRYNRFEGTGLTQALHGYIERLPLPENGHADEPLPMLVAGLHVLLNRPPFVERQECPVSQEFVWLLHPAVHAVEKLVSACADAAMQEPALAIMINAPAVNHWHDLGIHEYRDRLGDLVPAWTTLNDALFWHNVKIVRTRLKDEGKKLDDDRHLQWPDHYWHFGRDSFPRVLEWLKVREVQDDRLVALSLAFRVNSQAGESTECLGLLTESVEADAVLAARLDEMLNRTSSEEVRERERKWEERERRRHRQHREEDQRRLDWIARLKADPDLVRCPPELRSGQVSNDQYRLLREIEGTDLLTDRTRGADWRSLIDEFGEDVATAYRDAAMAHWRHCKPGLRSEVTATNEILPSSVFGLVGLYIEADEVDRFPAHLRESEVRLALRYIFVEINGFPRWLESIHRVYPQTVLEFVENELFWELANTEPDQPLRYILQNLAHYAPWLHNALAGTLLTWLRANDPPSVDVLNHLFRILEEGCMNPVELATLAKAKALHGTVAEHRPYWYALWIDAHPDTGIAAVEDWLAELDRKEGSHAAQVFVTALIGSRHRPEGAPSVGNFRTPRHLKALYVLMHQHISTSEDIDRAGGGVYSPGLRDDAQDSRNALFHLLSEIPGKETYVALTELIKDHPDPNYRPSMVRWAQDRALADGDLEPWTARQVYEFGTNLTTTPRTQRQLFDLTVARVTDLKDWIEQGNDSPYRTWQKAQDETEIRNLVAGWLNETWGNPLPVAQEPELANGQRMDISLQSPDVPTSISIELKLLDKGWTGPKLCERLRNQLAGDYLREGSERCGVMLLFWQGTKPGRRWQIGGQRVGVSDICAVLKRHWDAIACSFPNVAAVEIVLIDLTARASSSGREH